MRADTVLLENGDRLTGEVQKLAEKKLAFKTTYAGTVQIDWNEVEQLSTKEPFDVEMETGMRYRGTLQEADEGIDVVAEDTTVTVNPIQLVAMTSVTDQKPPGFFDTLQGDVDAGLTLNRGNSRLTQNSLGVKTEYRREKYRVSGGFTSLLSRQEDSESTRRQTAEVRYDRFFNPRRFAFVFSDFERNHRQELKLRSQLGGGLGFSLIKKQDAEFSLLGGVTFTREEFQEDVEDLPENPNRGEGIVGFEFQKTWNKKIEWNTSFSFLPNLKQRGRYRLEFDSTARVPLIKSLSWSMTLFDRFDGDPPGTDVVRNDFGLVSALGYSF